MLLLLLGCQCLSSQGCLEQMCQLLLLKHRTFVVLLGERQRLLRAT
jgi:hypothetical protein